MKRIIMIIYIFISCVSLSAYEKPNEITFVLARPKEDKGSKWLIDLYTEAFSRMGIKFNIYNVPTKRAGVMANSGEVDGEASRVYSYSQKFKNLVRVEEHNNYIIFAAYSTNDKIKLKGWESLQGTDYNIEYRLGLKKAETEVPKYVEKKNITEIRLIDNALKMLIVGRMDLYIEIENYFKNFMEHKKFESEIYNVGVMEKVTAHGFLHKKHKELEPELSSTIKEMKQDGTVAEILAKHNLDIEY